MGDWKKIKLKYVVKLRTEQDVYKVDDKYIGLENIESMTGKFIKGASPATTAVGERCNVYKIGDVLFSKLRPYLAKAFVAEDDGFCSSEFLVFKDFDGDRRYLFYILLSKQFLDAVNASTYGVKMPRANWSYIGNLKIPLPPLDEQRAIADSLDARTSNIRRLIELRTREIELLHEYKRALISEAMTQNLLQPPPPPPHNKFIKKLTPAHRRAVRLKYIVTIKNGGDCPKYDEGLYPVIGSGGEFARTDRFIYDKPSVLLGRKGTIDKPVFVDEPFWVVDTMYYTIPKNGIDMKFFYYCCTQIDFDRHKSGAVLPSMTQQELYSIKVPLPPLEEQRAVAAFLDRKCRAVGRLIDNCQRQILLLRELQRATISEAVTGKTPNIATGG